MYNNDYSDIRIRSPRYTTSIRSPSYTTNDYLQQQLFENTDVFDESANGSHRYPNIPNITSIRSSRYTNPSIIDRNNYTNTNIPSYPNTTSIRSSRYTNPSIIDQNIYPSNYTNIIDPNIYPNTSIRSSRYINRNTYSNLPENWSEHISHSGLPYYYNSITGESQWQHPTINTHLPPQPVRDQSYTNTQRRILENTWS